MLNCIEIIPEHFGISILGIKFQIHYLYFPVFN